MFFLISRRPVSHQRCSRSTMLGLYMVAAMLPLSSLAEVPVEELGSGRSAPIDSKPVTREDRSMPMTQRTSTATPGTRVFVGEQGNNQQSAADNRTEEESADNAVWELYRQMELQREQLRELQGMVEEQAHIIERMQREQRDRYIDLDRRISEVAQKVSGGGSSQVFSTTTGSASVVKKSGPQVTTKSTSTQPVDTSGTPVETLSSDQVKQVYMEATQFRNAKEYDKAIDKLNVILKADESGNFVPYAHYWLGEMYLVAEPPKKQLAKKHFEVVIDKYGSHSKVPAAMYKLAKTLDQEGNAEKAKTVLNEIIVAYPDHTAAKLARRYLDQM